jgi:Domain of unknown function (DUF5658)
LSNEIGMVVELRIGRALAQQDSRQRRCYAGAMSSIAEIGKPPFSLREKLMLVATLALLQFADVISTKFVLLHGGTEGNPIAIYLINRLGDYWWLPRVLLITAILIMVLPLTHSRGVKWAFIIVNAVYFGVALNNMVNALVLGAHGG